MNRLEEVQYKHDLIKKVLDAHQSDVMWVLKTRNIAWLTAGADASIPLDTEFGIYSLLYTRDARYVVTQNIEYPRLRDEEELESLGFEFKVYDWYGETPERIHGFLYSVDPQNAADGRKVMITDAAAEADLFPLRSVLLPEEQARFRTLCQDAAAALEWAVSAARPGESEWKIAARLDQACRERGGVAIVNLVATDERISRFRHPLVTNATFDHTLMMVVCMRREGLIAAATRFSHVGAVSAELAEKVRRVSMVDAAAMIASKPGRRLNEVFADIQAAYAAQSEPRQWQLHHQGGLIGYNSREQIATPLTDTVICAGHAFAWNPSIVGYKSEDTILVNDSGFEILTMSGGNFPTLTVEVNGQRVIRPAILEV